MTGRRKIPNLMALSAFEASASALNFTRAAEILNVQQPSISRRIAELEAWLGVDLFVRDGTRLSLTEPGRDLISALPSILNDLEDLLEAARRTARKDQVLIDVSTTFASLWLMPRLDQLQRAFPSVEFQLVSRHLNTQGVSPLSDLVIYFRDTGQHFPDQLRLTREELKPFCTPHYLDAAPAISREDPLRGQRILVLSDGHHAADWEQLLGRDDWRANDHPNTLYLSNFTVYLNAILAGHGIGLAWPELVADHIAAGVITSPIDISYRSDRGYFAFLTAPGLRKPVAKAVLKWLQDAARVPDATG